MAPVIHEVSCEFGLVSCPPHEQCMASSKDSSRSMNGVCQCVDGYKRDEHSGMCILNGKIWMYYKVLTHNPYLNM